MSIEENKQLYKMFEYFKDPIIIRQKIKEYQEESTLIKCKNIIKNYKRNKEQVELAIVENSNNINRTKMLREMFRNRDLFFYDDPTLFEYSSQIEGLNSQMNNLHWKYWWAKTFLKEHYNKIKNEED